MTLDARMPAVLDLYSPLIRYQRPVYRAGALTAEPHKLTIQWAGQRTSKGPVAGLALSTNVAVLMLVEVSRLALWTPNDNNRTAF